MHSFWLRLNALLTLSVTILTIICAFASFSDCFNPHSPTVDIQVLNIQKLQKLSSGNDQVKLNLNVTADLNSLFTWNTKQVFVYVAAEYETRQNAFNQISLWDAIIPSQDHAKFSIRIANKYKFTDQGRNLLGKEFNLTLHWHIMPKTGRMLADEIVKSGYRLPDEYI